MIDKNEEYVLATALASESIASEVVARVIDATPASAPAAQALLDVIDSSEKEEKEIREYLIVATAKRSSGNEIADQLELVVECLEAQALGIPGNAALNAAQAKLANLSDEAKEILVITIANRTISDSIASKIDIATQSAAAIADAV